MIQEAINKAISAAGAAAAVAKGVKAVSSKGGAKAPSLADVSGAEAYVKPSPSPRNPCRPNPKASGTKSPSRRGSYPPASLPRAKREATKDTSPGSPGLRPG